MIQSINTIQMQNCIEIDDLKTIQLTNQTESNVKYRFEFVVLH